MLFTKPLSFTVGQFVTIHGVPSLGVKGQLMVTSNDYFVFVRQWSHPLVELPDFSKTATMREVTSMDKNITIGNLGEVITDLSWMCVTDAYYSDLQRK